jgi:superfamily II DNA/RNA helicase
LIQCSPNATRIGRTGRAGLKGESFTFLTSSGEDVWKAMGIVEVMQKTNQVVPPQVQVKKMLPGFATYL